MENNFKADGVDLSSTIVSRTDAQLLPAGTYLGAGTVLSWSSAQSSTGNAGNANLYGVLGVSTTVANTVPSIVGQAGNWKSVYTGTGTSFGIDQSNKLWAWGSNDYAQLGTGDITPYSSPIQVGSASNWQSIATGAYHTVGVKTDGTLWAWGAKGVGQLGNGETSAPVNISSPTQVGSLTNWKYVTGSPIAASTAAAIKTDGTLWVWGYRSPLGVSVSSPIQVGSGTSWAKAAIGNYGSAAYTVSLIKSDGTLWGLGDNTYGQIGDGTQVYRSTPVQVGTDTNWDAVYSGASAFTLGRKTDGTLWAWGWGQIGTLGNNNTTNKSSPTQIGTDTDWAMFSVGSSSCAAIKTDGSLWTWGSNSTGALGDGTIVNKSSPVQIGTGYSYVSVGKAANMHAIKTDGTLWTWGSGFGGALGDGTIVNKSSPVQIGSLTTWVSVAAGGYYATALKSDGTLWAWGYNFEGELGDGTVVNKSSPVQIGTLTTWSSAQMFNTASSMVVKSDGTLWVWGAGTAGQLGISADGLVSSPIQIGAATTWAAVAAGSQHTIATQSDGTLWAWGYNAMGQLGNGNTINTSVPTQISPEPRWSAVSINGSSAAASAGAIKPDGTLWTWGLALAGALGNGTATPNRSSPTQVGSLTNWSKITVNTSGATGQTMYAVKTDGTLWAWGLGTSGQLGDSSIVSKSSPIQVGILTDWDRVYGSGNASAYAIKTDGTLWAWGLNTSGALGDGSSAHKSSPVQIGSLTNWAKVAGMSTGALALKTDGTLWSWGVNTSGQLGSGTVTSRSSPVQIGADTNWSDIAGGSSNGYGIKTDGTLWSWGANSAGQLGDGTVVSKSSPIQVGSLTNWSKIASGPGATGTAWAVKTDGTLWSWGAGTAGQLGDGTIVSKSSPVQIGTFTDWTDIYSDGSTVLTVKADGTMYAWGAGASGQLGNFASASAYLPIQTATLPKWSSLYSTLQTSHGIKDNGTLWAWGDNTYGLLGTNNATNFSSPVQIGALTNWKSLSEFGTTDAATSPFVAAVTTDGLLYTWGSNTYGQLGSNTITSRSSPVQVGALANWISASAGAASLVATKTDGTLWHSGMITSAGETARSSPLQVGAGSLWKSVTAGGRDGSNANYNGLTKY
jgi:alpha-tubulin suppressor-like RCC1 family protein